MDDLKICFDYDDEIHRHEFEKRGKCSSCGYSVREKETRIVRMYVSDIRRDQFTASIPMISDLTKYTLVCENPFAVSDEDEYTSNGTIRIFQLENMVYVMKVEFDETAIEKTSLEMIIEIYGQSLEHFQRVINDIVDTYDQNTSLQNTYPVMIDYNALDNAIKNAILLTKN